MVWCLQIVEWTESPEQAIEFSIYLNDKYEIDGRDSNGYVGCMWCCVGIHDQVRQLRFVSGSASLLEQQRSSIWSEADCSCCRAGVNAMFLARFDT